MLQINETKAEIETILVIVETKISKYSTWLKQLYVFHTFNSLDH